MSVKQLPASYLLFTSTPSALSIVESSMCLSLVFTAVADPWCFVLRSLALCQQGGLAMTLVHPTVQSAMHNTHLRSLSWGVQST